MPRNYNTLPRTLSVAALAAASLALTACTGERSIPEASSVSATAVPPHEAPHVNRGDGPSPGLVSKAAGVILYAANTRPKGPHDIYKKDLRSGEVTNLTNTPQADELNPQPSPDGKQIVMASDRSGTYQIYRFPLARPDAVNRLTNNGASDYDPTYTPDGKNILYKSNKDDGYGDIWKMDADGGNPVNLTPGRPNTEEWSPAAITNNQYIFTTQHADDGSMDRAALARTSELAVLDASSGNVTQLTHNTVPDWYPAPDRSHPGVVAFTSKQEDGGRDAIFSMDIAKPDAYDGRKLLVGPAASGGDSSDPFYAGETLLFVNNGGADGVYMAQGLKPNGDIFGLQGDVQGDTLSPVAVGDIAAG